jgi:glutaconate CoA-transferase subunit A
VIVVVEEVVSDEVIRADPNRTIIPGLIVDAVVAEPWGAHPSYVQGAYDRDNRFYLDWDPISRDEAATQAWLAEWVHGVSGRAEYLEKLGSERVASLRPSEPAPSGEVDYGAYR